MSKPQFTNEEKENIKIIKCQIKVNFKLYNSINYHLPKNIFVKSMFTRLNKTDFIYPDCLSTSFQVLQREAHPPLVKFCLKSLETK